MSVAFRSAATSTTATGTTASVTKPAGLADGDVAVLRVLIYRDAFNGSTTAYTITLPSGFTLRDRQDWNGVNGSIFTDDASTVVATKLITSAAGEPSTWDVTLSASCYTELDASAYTGCDTSSSSAHLSGVTGNKGQNNATATGLGLTFGRDGSMAVFQCTASTSDWTADPSGFTKRVDYDGNVHSYDRAYNTGATGNITATSGGTNPDWYVQMIGLQPAASGTALATRKSLLGVGI